MALEIFRRGDIVTVGRDPRYSNDKFIIGNGTEQLSPLKPGQRFRVIEDGTIDSVEVEQIGDVDWYGTAYADVDSFIVANICPLDCGGTICALARNRKGDRESFYLMYKGREVRPFRGN